MSYLVNDCVGIERVTSSGSVISKGVIIRVPPKHMPALSQIDDLSDYVCTPVVPFVD